MAMVIQLNEDVFEPEKYNEESISHKTKLVFPDVSHYSYINFMI